MWMKQRHACCDSCRNHVSPRSSPGGGGRQAPAWEATACRQLTSRGSLSTTLVAAVPVPVHRRTDRGLTCRRVSGEAVDAKLLPLLARTATPPLHHAFSQHSWAPAGEPPLNPPPLTHTRTHVPPAVPVVAGAFTPVNVRYSGERCCVCDADTDYDFDQLVSCDMCGITLHQVRTRCWFPTEVVMCACDQLGSWGLCAITLHQAGGRGKRFTFVIGSWCVCAFFLSGIHIYLHPLPCARLNLHEPPSHQLPPCRAAMASWSCLALTRCGCAEPASSKRRAARRRR